MNLHDVVRHLVRSSGVHDELNLRRLLLAVDADEQGYPNLESYEQELAARAEAERQANAPPPPPDARDTRIAELEAQLAERDKSATKEPAKAGKA